MKKCKCKFGRFLLKLLGVALVANVALFIVVEPFLKKHYDDMERKDTLQMPYDMDKYPKYDY